MLEFLLDNMFGFFLFQTGEEVFNEIASDLEDLSVLVDLVLLHGQELGVSVEFGL